MGNRIPAEHKGSVEVRFIPWFGLVGCWERVLTPRGGGFR